MKITIDISSETDAKTLVGVLAMEGYHIKVGCVRGESSLYSAPPTYAVEVDVPVTLREAADEFLARVNDEKNIPMWINYLLETIDAAYGEVIITQIQDEITARLERGSW